MPSHTPVSKAAVLVGPLAAVVAFACLALSACAPPIRLAVPPAVAPSAEQVADAPDDGLAPEPPIVVLRYYAYSPTVDVVGWDADRSAYGLRSTVRRDGTLVQDHQLYVSTYHLMDVRSFFRADWHAFTNAFDQGRPLLFMGMYRDVRACEGDRKCSPYETLEARISDTFLRAGRDDILVKVYGRDGREVALTLSRELIDAYLGKVDFVSASMRAQFATQVRAQLRAQ